MQEITVYDVDGNSLTNLVQWDKDVYVYVNDSYIDSAYQVHFFNDKMDEALVVISAFSDGILKAKIPNVLLTQSYPITGYINITKNEEKKCLYCFRIAVRKKPKPSDYIFVESDDYILLESILEECKSYAGNAKESSDNAKTSETNSKASEINAKNSESNAKKSQTASANSASQAASSATTASQKADAASNSANLSKSYAVGGTGTRTNEDSDNAKYYYNQSLKVVQGLNGTLLPMGTITFEKLSSSTKKAGYMYNISNDFISDSSFKDGGNQKYAAGTNVYYTADGYWDCLTGVMVTGIKGNSESAYRHGDVNITKENIGLGNVPNVRTNDQTPTFSEASSRSNIVSGESLSTILGKIKKFFTDLKPIAFSGKYSDLTGSPIIANNLTTIETGDVLDASQGKVLYDKYISINDLLADDISQSDIDALF